MKPANYRIVKLTSTYILIYDMGPWHNRPTVTNDAENVVRGLFKEYGNLRIFYYDSGDCESELCHKDGVFTGFGNATHDEVST